MSQGQTIADRLQAARHVIDGSTVNKSVVKATTHELVAPKRKHTDYLVTLTGAPNINLPELANHLVDRTRNSSWVVVFKALITTHHLMCYGNERFLQSCASRNTLFSLTGFDDRSNPQGYDMSTFVRRYARYLNAKAASYRTCAYDFTRIKRQGGSDSSQSFKSMGTEPLLKTLPTLQLQIDELLNFSATSNEITNGVINCGFNLLFKDLVRLFAGYNDGIINLLQKYFEMKKSQCKEALDIYKRYLGRMQKVQDFFKVAENVGIDNKGDTPDLTSAPSSLLDALQEHLNSLEGKKSGTVSPTSPITTSEAERVIQEERKKLEEYARKKNSSVSPPPTSLVTATPVTVAAPSIPKQPTPVKPLSPQNDLFDLSSATNAIQSNSSVTSPTAAKPTSAVDDLLDLDCKVVDHGTAKLNSIMAIHQAQQVQQHQQQNQFYQPSPYGVVPQQTYNQGFQNPNNPFAPAVNQQPAPMGNNPFAVSGPFSQNNNFSQNINNTQNQFNQFNNIPVNNVNNQFNNMNIGQQQPRPPVAVNPFGPQSHTGNPFVQSNRQNPQTGSFSLLD